MIEKCRRPEVFDFRPIALIDISYKILMSFVRLAIVDHITINELGRDTQTGFTGGGRPEYNILAITFAVEAVLHNKNTNWEWRLPEYIAGLVGGGQAS